MATTYKPRRQSARYLDGDCPPDVLCILYAGKRTADPWTVIYRHVYVVDADAYLFGRGMSDAPASPGGVGLTVELKPYEVSNLRARQRGYRWSELPGAVQDCIRSDCAPGGLGSALPEIAAEDHAALGL